MKKLTKKKLDLKKTTIIELNGITMKNIIGGSNYYTESGKPRTTTLFCENIDGTK